MSPSALRLLRFQQVSIFEKGTLGILEKNTNRWRLGCKVKQV